VELISDSFLARFTDIFWIDASSQDTIQACLIAISSNSSATAVGVKPTVESVLQWLGAKKDEWLLIFDGADHDPELISQFLPAMNRGNILISTRNLHMQRIAGMTYEITDMSQQEAITLLLRSAGTGHDPNSPHDRELAAPIVEELCCMPLAVDSAGAAIMNCIASLSDYLSIYHRHRIQLSDNTHLKGQSKYDRALYTTWDISFNAILDRASDSATTDGRSAAIAILLLRIFSLLHYERIPESLFSRAAISKEKDIPNEHILSAALQLDVDNKWNSLMFRSAIRILSSFSFVKTLSIGTFHITMHHLVHGWIRDRMPSGEQREIVRIIRSLLRWSIPQGSLVNYIPYCREIVIHISAHCQLVAQCVSEYEEEDDTVLDQMGEVTSIIGYYNQARDFQQQVLNVRQRLLGEEDEKTWETMLSLAWTYLKLGQYQSAKELQMKVLERWKKLLGNHHVDTLWAMANLASTYRYLGEYHSAQELNVKVLEGRKQLLGNEHVDTLQAMSNLATTYRHLGEYHSAQELEVKVLEEWKQRFGDDHADTLTARANLAATYRHLGEYHRAHELEVKVLEGWKQLLGDEHVNTLSAMANLASTYQHLNEYHKAQELQVKVLEGWKQLLGDEHVDTLSAMANLASTYCYMGKYHIAQELEVKVLARRKQLLGEEHVNTLLAMHNLACTYKALGRLKEAQELLSFVIPQRKAKLGPAHQYTVFSVEALHLIEAEIQATSKVY
jgi:tetratricopeptide (TPR) repeat protein